MRTKILEFLYANSIIPYQRTVLPTGLICLHYANGNVKVINPKIKKYEF